MRPDNRRLSTAGQFSGLSELELHNSQWFPSGHPCAFESDSSRIRGNNLLFWRSRSIRCGRMQAASKWYKGSKVRFFQGAPKLKATAAGMSGHTYSLPPWSLLRSTGESIFGCQDQLSFQRPVSDIRMMEGGPSGRDQLEKVLSIAPTFSFVPDEPWLSIKPIKGQALAFCRFLGSFPSSEHCAAETGIVTLWT